MEEDKDKEFYDAMESLPNEDKNEDPPKVATPAPLQPLQPAVRAAQIKAALEAALKKAPLVTAVLKQAALRRAAQAKATPLTKQNPSLIKRKPRPWRLSKA